jgi:Glu-tRNA(Gln) amidotransferase subunit E-like FAD-binding protein
MKPQHERFYPEFSLPSATIAPHIMKDAQHKQPQTANEHVKPQNSHARKFDMTAPRHQFYNNLRFTFQIYQAEYLTQNNNHLNDGIISKNTKNETKE